MKTIAIIGAQWGDEGKGKIVDALTSNSDFVVRFQGGNNAGHTLVVDGNKTSLHLIPSGILRDKSVCLIGAGVVVDPEIFCQEIDSLSAKGVDVSSRRIVVDFNANLILPYHKLFDKYREIRKGNNKIGTTQRGIGPAYEDMSARTGVRLIELKNLSLLRTRLEKLVEQKNKILLNILESEEVIDFDRVWRVILLAQERLFSYGGDVSVILNKALKEEKRIVFEGAQGALLDKNFGTIPYVTSSNTIAGAVCTGCGVGPKAIEYVLGVSKAYATRVGRGPFPTEITGDIAEYIRENGNEFGTTTGRSRRIGWLDACALKKAIALNGCDSIALTKLDVLSKLDKIYVSIGYYLNGKEVDTFPLLLSDTDKLEPKYLQFEGWQEDISNVKKWHHLPKQAQVFISACAEILSCPITVISVGPSREQLIFLTGSDSLLNFL